MAALGRPAGAYTRIGARCTLSRTGSSARSRLAVSTAARLILPGLLLEQPFHL